MNLDALTLSALALSVVVLFAIILVVRNAEKQTEIKLRKVAQQSMLMDQDPTARDLCRGLRLLYPDACPGLDYLVAHDGGDEPAYIAEWNLDEPRPTPEQIRQVLEKHTRAGAEGTRAAS